MQNTSYLKLIAQKLLIVLLLYSVCRALFFVFNFSYFSEQPLSEIIYSFIFGVRFDFSVISISNSLIVVLLLLPLKLRENKIYIKGINILFLVINSIALLLNCVDFAFYKFTLKRLSADVFKTPEDISDILLNYIIDYWYLLFIWILLVAILIVLNKKINTNYFKPSLFSFRNYLLQSLLFIVAMFFMLVGYRGGLQLKPIHMMDAGMYVNARNIPLVVNSPFSIMRTLDQKQLTEKNYFSQKKLTAIFNPLKTKTTFSSPPKKQNVVIIVMESFSNEYIGFFNKGKGYTPFLDSLCRKSLVFTNTFANAKNSKDGIPAILAGLPALQDESYIHSAYSINTVNSLPSLLKNFGYSTSFYHGGNNGTMGFDVFCKNIGFDEYKGRSEYNNEKDFDGAWGIFDEPYFNYYADELNKKNTPFFSCIFSLSSHHPYPIPEKYKNKFPKGTLEIHESIGYSDYSLKKFFEKTQKTPWFNNTLFVITADHTSISKSFYYHFGIGAFSIPIIFYSPNNVSANIDATITQQIDILPTIINYLQLPTSFFSFGNNINDTLQNHYAISYINKMYQLISDKYILQFDGENSKGFYLRTDSTLKKNLIFDNIPEKTKMENYVKALIQSYNNGLINNKTAIETCK